MWQKLNRLDVVNLEKARVQITNVLQLVAAPLRSFKANADKKNFEWPKWDRETSSFLSNKFGENQEISVTLDIEKFILSINGSNQKKEHLVLSGMTYPMAYGWMKIKLEGFKLDTNQFDDNASYELESYLKPEAELSSDDQFTYDQIVIHYSNASHLLNTLKKELDIDGDILIDPATANMVLYESSRGMSKFGFSLGNKSFPEPYFFIKTSISSDVDVEEFEGVWNNAQSQLIFMASDFLNQNPDLEYQKVLNFFVSNFAKIPK